MTPEEINIAIAEACGWTDLYPHHKDIPSPAYATSPSGVRGQTVPNFYGDLNACHEMEKYLFGSNREEAHLWEDYIECLENICGCDGWGIMKTDEKRKMIHATAPQRCESFLKTLGLWKDSAQS